jgi:hypothetical protein
MKKFCIILSMLCILITSCSTIHHSPDKPPIDFDSNYLNQQIRLLVVPQLGAFKTNSDMALLLEYDTVNEIVFPSNFNLRIFVQQANQWIETKEKPTIRPTDPVILSPKSSSQGSIVAFWPQLDNLTKTYYMRVYVFGDMKTSDGSKQVAAFADFVLTP